MNVPPDTSHRAGLCPPTRSSELHAAPGTHRDAGGTKLRGPRRRGPGRHAPPPRIVAPGVVAPGVGEGGASRVRPPSRPRLLVCDTRGSLTRARRRLRLFRAVTSARRGLPSLLRTGGAGPARPGPLPGARGSWAERGSGPGQADAAPERTPSPRCFALRRQSGPRC